MARPKAPPIAILMGSDSDLPVMAVVTAVVGDLERDEASADLAVSLEGILKNEAQLTVVTDRASGTPMTGSSVWAATTPARCAEPPAPAITSLKPRRSASRAKRVACSGLRWAESTRMS